MPDEPAFSHYKGRWVATIRDRVVGQGGTPRQAMQAAKASRHKETPKVIFVPKDQVFEFSPILGRIRDAINDDTKVYIVGGAVRDVMLSRPIHDYDFLVLGDALQFARKVADQLNGAYFPLDEERSTGRVVYSGQAQETMIFDFAACRGGSLENDLKDRDFTVNSMAVDIQEEQALLDPLGGASDLWHKEIKACSPSTFVRDPLRILRAIRMAAGFGMRIQPDTRALMREAVHLLVDVSQERLRDELLKMMGGPRPHTTVRALDLIGALDYILPELGALKGVNQSPPHVKDVWEHTLDTLKNLEKLLNVLFSRRDPDDALGLMLGLGVIQLGKYRTQIIHHLEREPVPGRNLRSLLFFAGLYHDISKPERRHVDPDGRIRFFGHEQTGSDIIARRAADLNLSRREGERLKVIVCHHMRPAQLAREEQGPSSKAIYRYFRDCSDIGIDIGLLSLADILATYGTTLPQERWARQLEVVRTLFDSWWERAEKDVNPPSILNGHDLQTEFELQPGPRIGIILEKVREAQAAGEVETRDDAIHLVKTWLE